MQQSSSSLSSLLSFFGSNDDDNKVLVVGLASAGGTGTETGTGGRTACMVAGWDRTGWARDCSRPR